MERANPYSVSNSATPSPEELGRFDLTDKTGEWDEEEAIDLGSEEHDLFLKDDYVTTSSGFILPSRVVSQQQNEFRGRTPNGISNPDRQNHRHNNLIDRGHSGNFNDHSNRITKEQFSIDDSGRGSPTPPSTVIYQMPNYEQFAGNLAPTSTTSVLVSFVIIFVILAVTIVPKIIPRSSPEGQDDAYIDYDYDYIELSNSKSGDDLKIQDIGHKTSAPPAITTAQEQDHQKPMHSDVRCKCICPPFPSSNDKLILNSSHRRLYVGNTRPDQCNCLNIVRPHFKTDTKMLLRDFCVRCECKFQNRNTRTIKRNVIFFIAVSTGLSLYLVVQYLLKHFRITRRSLPRHLRWLHHQMANESY